MPSPLGDPVCTLAVASGDLAAAALALAALALIAVGALGLRIRKLRSEQRVLLATGESEDLVSAVAELTRRGEAAARSADDLAAGLSSTERALSERLDRCVAHTAVIRYDAYNEMTGRQSSSIALLDSAGTGVVISSILHREQARMYAKPVRDGSGEVDLSPEEEAAVETAMGGGR